MLDERAAHLRQGEDGGSVAASAPGRPDPDPARVAADRDVRLGGHVRGLPAWSSVIGATVAFESARRVAGGTGKTAVAVPAAAHTTWNRPRSGSMITRIARLWPIGGIPPIVKPERSFASRAVARRMLPAPVTAASRARSTRFGPDTRQRIGSSVPSSPGATKTSDFT